MGVESWAVASPARLSIPPAGQPPRGRLAARLAFRAPAGEARPFGRVVFFLGGTL